MIAVEFESEHIELVSLFLTAREQTSCKNGYLGVVFAVFTWTTHRKINSLPSMQVAAKAFVLESRVLVLQIHTHINVVGPHALLIPTIFPKNTTTSTRAATSCSGGLDIEVFQRERETEREREIHSTF